MPLTKINSPRFEHANVLVYGEPGTWKSRALTTFTKGRILLFVSEPGIITPLTFPGFAERADVYAIENWGDFEKFRTNPMGWLKSQGIKLEDYSLVALDGVTELFPPIKKWVLENFKTRSGERLDIGTWGIVKDNIRGFVLSLCKLPIRTYTTAQLILKEVDTPEGQTMQMFLPSSVGAFSIQSGHLFDFVLKSRVNAKGEPKLITQAVRNIIAKTRGFEPPKEIDFNLDKLFDLVESSVPKAEEKE